jgi:Fic-DOC domain mobile mystery protein B
MGLNLNYIEGQTPIDEDEKEGLKISAISTIAELNEFEQLNIEKAFEWILRRKPAANKILTEEFVKELHKRMFGDVWKWAGAFRNSNKNIGVDKYQIGTKLRDLLEDCKYWIEHKTYNEDEIAIRFSHRIVSIHPFPNGNGRHSRLIADCLIFNGFNKPYFTWGSKNLTKKGEARSKYLEALKEADDGDYNLLIEFSRK